MLTSQQIALFLAGLGVILVVARTLGALSRRLGQPAVIGEILAGIAFGPTVLHGAIGNTLFSTAVRPGLSALADLGVALFMFFLGLEFDLPEVRKDRRTIAAVSVGSWLLPFGLGLLLALGSVGHRTGQNGFASVLAVGIAISVTAFPVMARILFDRGMTQTRIGRVALASAATGDVLAWSLLALVTLFAVADAHWWRLLLITPFVALLYGTRPLLRRLTGERPAPPTAVFVVVLALVLLAGAATEWMGLHFIFGAFLAGLVIPRDGLARVKTAVVERTEFLSTSLLMPVYFIMAGLQVDLSHLTGNTLGELGLIMLISVGGKFAGVFTAARASNIDQRRSAALAALMNSRGLTELVILTTLLRIGLIDHDLYSLLVVMALVTTAMTGPLLGLFYPPALVEQDLAVPIEPRVSRERPKVLQS